MISNHSNTNRRAVAFGIAAPLTLALAACGGDVEETGAEGGEAIAAIDAPDGSSWTETVTISDQGGYVLGNPDAPLKLVEYASHTCGACAQFSATAKPSLKADYVATGVVSFEQRNLVRDPVDLSIAALVRCGQPESMQVLSDQAWQNFNDVMGGVSAAAEEINATGELPLEQRFVRIGELSGLIDFFSARGLSADQARSCLADTGNIEAIANASAAQAEELGVQSTPTFFLNGRVLEERSWAQIEPVLQRAGARTE